MKKQWSQWQMTLCTIESKFARNLRPPIFIEQGMYLSTLGFCKLIKCSMDSIKWKDVFSLRVRSLEIPRTSNRT